MPTVPCPTCGALVEVDHEFKVRSCHHAVKLSRNGRTVIGARDLHRTIGNLCRIADQPPYRVWEQHAQAVVAGRVTHG